MGPDADSNPYYRPQQFNAPQGAPYNPNYGQPSQQPFIPQQPGPYNGQPAFGGQYSPPGGQPSFGGAQFGVCFVLKKFQKFIRLGL